MGRIGVQLARGDERSRLGEDAGALVVARLRDAGELLLGLGRREDALKVVERILHFRVDPRSPRGGYDDVELYLLGLADPSEVGPHVVFADQSQGLTLGATLRGPTTTVTIDDIVAANGPRRPAWDGVPKTFRMATIVVSRGRLLTPWEMAYYDRQAARGEATSLLEDYDFASPFFVNTGGRGILRTRLD